MRVVDDRQIFLGIIQLIGFLIFLCSMNVVFEGLLSGVLPFGDELKLQALELGFL